MKLCYFTNNQPKWQIPTIELLLLIVKVANVYEKKKLKKKVWLDFLNFE